MKDETSTAETGTGVSQYGKLAEVLLVTENMLILARDGLWDEVTALESKRQALLAECFSAPIEGKNTELFSEALAAMLNMNEELIAALEDAKKQVAIRRTDQKHAIKSVGYYLDVENNH